MGLTISINIMRTLMNVTNGLWFPHISRGI
jgi:hypothetical protein